MKKLLAVVQNQWVVLFCRILIATIFILASLDKIVDPRKFQASVEMYGMMPDMLMTIFTVVFPWIEMVAGVMLLVGYRVHSSSLLLLLSNSAFIVGIGYAMTQGKAGQDCGCFAPGIAEAIGMPSTIGWGALLRDLVFEAFLLNVFIDTKRFGSVDRKLNLE